MAVVGLGFLCAVAAVAGPLSHTTWFIHGEHDLSSIRYAAIWAALQAGSFFVLTRYAGESFGGALFTMSAVSSAYLAALFTSIAIYRVFFHRLRNFPGRLSWAMTKWTQAIANADGLGYKHLDDLHRQYGHVVRTGPNEISIVDSEGPQKVLGPGSKCYKAIWYDVGKPLVSVHQCRDKKLHDIRRRIWDKGFNAKSLRDYESRVASYADVLVDQIKAFGGKAFNASKWLNYYSFDVMGDLAFGESFHMLEKGEKHFAIPLLEAGMDPMNFIPQLPWLFYMIAQVPIISDAYNRFIKWSEEQVVKRKNMKVDEPDVMSYLLEAQPMSTDATINKNWEVGDARLIIVAGSDTTAATLSYCAYELISNPMVTERLRKEVEPILAQGTVDHIALQKCQELNAFIDEVLRLHPAVPSGLMRVAPPEGIEIAGTHIPGGTTIVLPLYSIQRSAEAYERPNEFLPERWTTSPQLIKKKGAFAPFSLGAFGCVGKQLAYMEVRTVVAKLITQFDLQFVAGDNGSNFIEKTEDHFTLKLADLNVVCKPRTV